jgi:hypothetical protein
MKLEYLQTAQPGARWFRGYYRQNPQLNLPKAVAALRVAESILREQPMAGTRVEGRSSVREYNITGTAFSLLYSVVADNIWIIDIRDQRGLRSAEALRTFTSELRQRFGLDKDLR